MNTLRVHAIALAVDLNKGFATAGKENKVVVFDLKKLSISKKIEVGANPDAIVYLPGQKQIYAFNGKSNSVSIIDAERETVVKTIGLPGKPEFAVYSAKLERVFVNIEDKNKVVSLNCKTSKAWPLIGCDSPSGIALDEKNDRSFSSCENEKMVVLNLKTGKPVASVSIGQGSDGAAFDPGLGLAFSSNGKSATITVILQKNSDHYEVIQSIRSELGARTLTLDKVNHILYTPTADLVTTTGGSRPKPVDHTQRLLSFGPAK